MIDCFIFERGEPPEALLPATLMASALDPGDNRDGKPLTTGPCHSVEHVSL